jgi:hypothetical protein
MIPLQCQLLATEQAAHNAGTAAGGKMDLSPPQRPIERKLELTKSEEAITDLYDRFQHPQIQKKAERTNAADSTAAVVGGSHSLCQKTKENRDKMIEQQGESGSTQGR